jgi:hypothetical protein
MMSEEELRLLRDANLAMLLNRATAAEAREAKMMKQAVCLWGILDDIDTLDDVCRDQDDLFRSLTRAAQQKRHEIMSGEEWDIARAAIEENQRG